MFLINVVNPYLVRRLPTAFSAVDRYDHGSLVLLLASTSTFFHSFARLLTITYCNTFYRYVLVNT